MPFKKRDFIKIDQMPKDVDLSDIPSDNLWRFVWFFVRQSKGWFFLISLIWVVSSGIDSLGPYFIKILIDCFQTVSDPQDIWQSFGLNLVFFVCVFLIFQPVLARIGVFIVAEVRPPFMNMIRRQLSVYLTHHQYQFFLDDFSGRLSSKVMETPYALISFVFTVLMSLTYAFMTLVVSLVLFASVDSVFMIITMVWLVSFVTLVWFYVPKVIHASHVSHEYLSQARGLHVDSLHNIFSVFLFNRRQHEDKRFLEILDKTSETGKRAWHVSNAMYMWLELISVLFIAVTFYVTVIQWQAGDLTLGEVAMVLPLMLRLMHTAWWVSEMFVGIFENIGQVKEGMEALTAVKIQKQDNTQPALITQKASVSFSSVDFSYGDKPVFEGLDLSIPSGQKIGLVGHSGAGKSSLIQILLRLYDIQGGRILINDQDISQVTQESLREHIAVIPQDTALFHRTLMENIRYGRLDASDEEVMEAAKKAHAHDFIADLPEGYETLVGERGVKLSGGQRQRIAIARAILKDAPILILDEATSALDSESERLIQESLKELMQGKTVIAIAHRLSTIAHLDRIIVMDGGKIVEDGTHDELLSKDRHYAMLWTMQSGGFLGDS